MGVENRRLRQQALHLLQRVERFDEARVMVQEGALRGAAEALAILGQLLVGLGRAALVARVQARQRPHPVNALGVADRLVVRRLQVGIA